GVWAPPHPGPAGGAGRPAAGRGTLVSAHRNGFPSAAVLSREACSDHRHPPPSPRLPALSCRATSASSWTATAVGPSADTCHGLQVIALVSNGVDLRALDEATLSAALYTSGLPDPDLIIRTAGELRVSNFLLWQGAYAELHVTETLWPDFGPSDLSVALGDFSSRRRTFGQVAGPAGADLAAAVATPVG